MVACFECFLVCVLPRLWSSGALPFSQSQPFPGDQLILVRRNPLTLRGATELLAFVMNNVNTLCAGYDALKQGWPVAL